MTPVRIVPRSAVPQLLPMRTCIDIVAEALLSLARDEAVQPLRTVVRPSGHGAELFVMPGHLSRPLALGVKLLTASPGDAGAGLPSYQGVVLLFDAETGTPQAVVD